MVCKQQACFSLQINISLCYRDCTVGLGIDTFYNSIHFNSQAFNSISIQIQVTIDNFGYQVQFMANFLMENKLLTIIVNYGSQLYPTRLH